MARPSLATPPSQAPSASKVLVLALGVNTKAARIALLAEASAFDWPFCTLFLQGRSESMDVFLKRFTLDQDFVGFPPGIHPPCDWLGIPDPDIFEDFTSVFRAHSV